MGIVMEVLQHEGDKQPKVRSNKNTVTDTAGAAARAHRAATRGAAGGTDRQAQKLEHLLDSRTGSGCGEAPG